MKKILKVFLICLGIVIAILAVIFCYFFVGSAPVQKNITWGVDFSQMQAESLKLNWKDAYSAIINDLGVKNIKLHTQWDWVEGNKGSYYFNDIDWQLATAQSKNVKIIYVVGIKSGRWPECHIPDWASNLTEKDQQQEALNYIKETVLRYKDNTAIIDWQVENEPLFNFGQCPAWYYDDGSFLTQEVALVKLLDPSRPVIISDSGEQSDWFGVAKIGDIVGITMYRDVWAHITATLGFNISYPLPPVNYYRKALLINKIFGKKVICIELQAEPWASKPFYDVPLSEQEETMSPQLFLNNVEYAKATGLDTFYFWGVEWWYWLKTTQNQPQIWNEAQKLFTN
jgi:hypothetical protein